MSVELFNFAFHLLLRNFWINYLRLGLFAYAFVWAITNLNLGYFVFDEDVSYKVNKDLFRMHKKVHI